MAERYVVLPVAAVMGAGFASYEDAVAAAGKKVEADGRPHVVVEVMTRVQRRLVPNVEIVPFEQFPEEAHAAG
ncbi:hypothetical protein [Vulcaniibacterium tengchongense]|uniref:Uncharacterized protein n=1 Tax=Vulcaniibacterium tengchongense TaxID=1273429 RepID=A0A3N4VRI2_9GAMM|nr:hypothetical protein [Vulcaniibacterium tengchongense]RPE81821.1 hypothetical protein EDC50_1023 [Vulcaniibacterium tengchongense]